MSPVSRGQAILRALAVLRDAAVRERGWMRRGVRGWMFRDEVEAATGERLSGVLPWLAARGLADRVDVRSAARRATWLYRVSARGLRLLAAHEGREEPAALRAPGDDPADAGALYLPRAAWDALETLRLHALEGLGRRRFGEHGWMTLAELRATGDPVQAADLGWLVRQGLAERRQVPGAAPPLRLFRATGRGLRAFLAGAGSHTTVQVGFISPFAGEADGWNPAPALAGPDTDDEEDERPALHLRSSGRGMYPLR